MQNFHLSFIGCKFHFNNPLGLVYPIPVFIELLNEQQVPAVMWNLSGAYPVRWSFDELNAQKSGLLIETLELNCNTITVEDI